MEPPAFHQTPRDLAAELMKHIPIEKGDCVLEPFRGNGAFFDAIPEGCERKWTEIADGRDFRIMDDEPYDWVVSNPPFKVDGWDKTPRNGNAFFPLLDYFTDRARKGVAFFGNDYCFASLMTPLRFAKIQSKGWFIQKVVVCNVRKWRGRYYLVIFTRTPASTFVALPGNW